MSRIRLLFVLTSPVRAGAEEVVLALLNGLDRREFRVALAAPGPLLHAMASELNAVEVETFQVMAESWSKPGEIKALASCIRLFRPDIVNPHLFRSALVSAPLAKWLGVPRVVETYHGREAWRRGLIKGNFIVDRTVSHWVDRVIAVSKAAADFLIQRKKVSPHKVVVVPNGCDLSAFRPGQAREGTRKELGIDPQAPVIGVVGRLEPQKGHRFLLESFALVLSEFPHAKLLVVGDGSLRGEIERQADHLGILPHTIFTGFRSDVPSLLDAMDLVVLPSLYEGMPLAAIEAAAMAKPIVATHVDGTAEVVEDGVSGRLVPPANPSALGVVIVALLRNPSQARQMGAAGRERALAHFDVSFQVETTAKVYREVLAYR